MIRVIIKHLIQIITEELPHISINIYSEGDWFVEKIDHWVQIEADITKEKPLQVSFEELLAVNRPIHKMLLVATPKEIQEMLEFLKTVDFEDMSFYLSKDNYLEVTSKSISKENALIEIAKYYQVPLENTMTIGGNYNDIPMLRLAVLGGHGNCSPKSKKLCEC